MRIMPAYVILCGMPRCGTRQFTDFLNRDDRLCIQGEIRAGLIPYLYDLVRAADDSYASGSQLKYYQRKRPEAVAELFAFFSKARRLTKPGAILHGFKTPNIEFLHEQLGPMFLPSVDSLVYLYSIRNIVDCFLSLSSMPWFRKTPEQFISRYIRSLNTAVEILEISRLRASKLRIGVMNLDAFIGARDKANWVIDNIYHPLGLELRIEQALECVSTTQNRNATLRVTGSERAATLPADVSPVFAERKVEINSAISGFNAAFQAGLMPF